MLMSCKCLNFIAISHKPQQEPAITAFLSSTIPTVTNDPLINTNLVSVAPTADAGKTCANTTSSKSFDAIVSAANNKNDNNIINLGDALKLKFLEKFPRNFIFYSECMDFFKQAIGPIPDLNITEIAQKDLIFSLTLEIGPHSQSWQLSICSNCSTVLCAKNITSTNQPVEYLINGALLTNTEELAQKRSDKSFSEAFGLLFIDHGNLRSRNTQTSQSLAPNFITGSLLSMSNLDPKQVRLRQLQANMLQRVQREIAETDERIQRFTEQQFALLKGFREKSEQEYHMLIKLIQWVSEQHGCERLDRSPPALEISGCGSSLPYYGSRRRNTTSTRELNVSADISVTQSPVNPLSSNQQSKINCDAKNNVGESLPNVSNTDSYNRHAVVVTSGNSLLNRKITNFDTPPATPEATSMSMSNSPTFRQQQQQQQQQQSQFTTMMTQHNFQQQFPTPSMETIDDCFFELEGLETTKSTDYNQETVTLIDIEHPTITPERTNTNNEQRHYYMQPESRMSDVDESDNAEEAEDALDMNVSRPIPVQKPRKRCARNSNVFNYAKSLPIEISKSPMELDRNYRATSTTDEDDIYNKTDIAASIKALAKSVHGETVFGDLPRPRLRSQI